MIAAGGWRVDAFGRVVPGGATGYWPSVGTGVRITFDAGFPDGACPAELIHAAKMFLGHVYANRETVITGTISGELPLSFVDLCHAHRMPVL